MLVLGTVLLLSALGIAAFVIYNWDELGPGGTLDLDDTPEPDTPGPW